MRLRGTGMSFEEFQEVAGELLDRVPAPLLEGLSGGVMARPEAKRRPGDPPGVRLLGEYVADPFLGCFVVLYYGSFARLFGGDRAAWEMELEATLLHEIRHHVEGRAGLEDLVREDLERLDELRRRR